MTALCRECDNVCSDTRKLSPFKWRCLRHPIKLQTPIGLEFVDPDWRPDPPYGICHVNNPKGECEHFAPRRTGQKEEAE